jgi:hypothetical protein
MVIGDSLLNRFWSKVKKTDNCWEWQACKNEHGYGILNIGKRGLGKIRAHRLSFIIHKGEIPESLLVCHRCDNPTCVNPEHLFLGTQKDNTQDMIKKGRGKGLFEDFGKYSRIKTHCPKGHPYSGTNLITRAGKRRCRICVNDISRKYRNANK